MGSGKEPLTRQGAAVLTVDPFSMLCKIEDKEAIMPRFNVCGMYQYKQHGALHTALADIEVYAPNAAGAIRRGLAYVQSSLKSDRTQDGPATAHRQLAWSVKPNVMEVVK